MTPPTARPLDSLPDNLIGPATAIMRSLRGGGAAVTVDAWSDDHDAAIALRDAGHVFLTHVAPVTLLVTARANGPIGGAHV